MKKRLSVILLAVMLIACIQPASVSALTVDEDNAVVVSDAFFFRLFITYKEGVSEKKALKNVKKYIHKDDIVSQYMNAGKYRILVDGMVDEYGEGGDYEGLENEPLIESVDQLDSNSAGLMEMEAVSPKTTDDINYHLLLCMIFLSLVICGSLTNILRRFI